MLRSITLGFENHGVHLDVVGLGGLMAPQPTAIRLTDHDRSFTLSSLSGLRGFVKISNEAEALRFVRLRTSRCYCYEWPGADCPQEIVSFSQAASTAFADTGCPEAHTGLESGRYGLVADRAYRLGHFGPPKVRGVPGGFEIERWVCLYWNLTGEVQLWQEFVGFDGAYRSKALKSFQPPALPGTKWHIYGLK